MDFEKTRALVVKLAATRSPYKDIIPVDGWFPLEGLAEAGVSRDETITEFSDHHALSRMVHFVFRIHLYERNGMVDISLIRHTFHGFFAHYKIVLLEFAQAFRNVRRRPENNHFDERWDLIPSGIESFFKSLGLAGSLPAKHVYCYFPSCNLALVPES